eukprot:CAMPEP_0114579314 /NCGR_PEP_ID=MMETSP0125-20121206/3717_1 /TAXON_ID=485358 ORGANISM="Aristerostoma sp., Strain ATCC 50986" /NCGR_SAMPLE_ID=MMETSP0125 /ASSEMBLY_ACC=CAM_ASM_000245 /LENGTH=90 /DNA_ID=CAMNT_0001769987 /DNA_START=373 /DNA_END=645 /DNA_ORIENTATION=+
MVLIEIVETLRGNMGISVEVEGEEMGGKSDGLVVGDVEFIEKDWLEDGPLSFGVGADQIIKCFEVDLGGEAASETDSVEREGNVVLGEGD